MTTNNHTEITENAPVNAGIFNSPMGEIDAAIGDLSSLTTSEKGSLVDAINELISNKTDQYLESNRHLDLDGTNVTVLVSDTYLQIDSISMITHLYLPAISAFGVGRELKIMLTSESLVDPYSILIHPYILDGDKVVGNYQLFPSTAGVIIFRTVASYPGKSGACWVRTTYGAAIA